jgi:hypothetical protein
MCYIALVSIRLTSWRRFAGAIEFTLLDFNNKAVPWPASAAVVVVYNLTTTGETEDDADRHPLAPVCYLEVPSREEWEEYKRSSVR